MNHVNDWYDVNRHVDNTKKWVLTNFFEHTRNFISVCIVALSSPQMFNKVIFEVVMGNHIFNLGGSLVVIFKRQPLLQM
jgi:hypothetical protein